METYAFSFDQYEKISDDIYNIGSKTVLRMNVILNKPFGYDNIRTPFHKEFMYESKKYEENCSVINIRRNFNYYLSLDKLDDRESSILIRPQDMMALQMTLSRVSNWFEPSSGTFGMRNKKLVVTKPEMISVEICNKLVMFDPVIILYEDGTTMQGIRMSLTRGDVYSEMNIDTFYGLLYTLTNFNMFQSAQLMLNYIGRPDFGSNLMVMDDSDIKPIPSAPSNQSKHKDVSTRGQKNKSQFG